MRKIKRLGISEEVTKEADSVAKAEQKRKQISRNSGLFGGRLKGMQAGGGKEREKEREAGVRNCRRSRDKKADGK